MPETRDIFSLLTARENLEIAARPGSRWTADVLLKRFPLLDKIKDRKGMHLSGGEQQMLSIARALMTGPQLLLLDEPSQGLAPILVEAVMEMIRELKEENVALLLVEQNVDLALGLADRAYVLDNGVIVFEGTSKQLAKNEEAIGVKVGPAEPDDPTRVLQIGPKIKAVIRTVFPEVQKSRQSLTDKFQLSPAVCRRPFAQGTAKPPMGRHKHMVQLQCRTETSLGVCNGPGIEIGHCEIEVN